MDRKKKIYIGLFVAAMVALAVDRFVLPPPDAGGPRPAEGASDEYAVPHSAGSADASKHLERDTAEEVLADCLDQLYTDNHMDLESLRDVFAPEGRWKSEQTRVEKAATAQAKVETFSEKHRLTAILSSGPHGQVVVEDTCVQVGEAFDGFVLTRVTETVSLWEGPAGKTAKLELDLAP